MVVVILDGLMVVDVAVVVVLVTVVIIGGHRNLKLSRNWVNKYVIYCCCHCFSFVVVAVVIEN